MLKWFNVTEIEPNGPKKTVINQELEQLKQQILSKFKEKPQDDKIMYADLNDKEGS